MYESSSSDGSDHAEQSRNVRRLLVKSEESQRDLDENYAYKQKLGDLRFDADFEGGNLGDVRQLNRYEYNLFIRPDVSNSRHCAWFNFTVSNQKPNQCVIFHFANLSERMPLFNAIGMTPVARSRLRPNWVRLKQDQIFYYKATERENRYILSIAFRFTFYDDEHQFALFYPYTITTLDNFITRWVVHLKRCELRLHDSRNGMSSVKSNRTQSLSRCDVSKVDSGARSTQVRSTTPSSSKRRSGPTPRGEHDGRQLRQRPPDRNAIAHLEVSVLTRSILSKPIYQMEISTRNDAAQGQRKSLVIIIGRPVGNFESASSLVCQGLLDFMLSDDPVATFARDQIDLVAFPMLDPDSTWVGNSRTDLMGQRTFESSTIAANPSIYENYRLAMERIKKLVTVASRNKAAVVAIEFRVDPDLIGSRIIGSLHGNSSRMERHLQLPRVLSRYADGFYLEKCEFISQSEDLADNPFKLGFNVSNADFYQLDVSPFGYHKRSLVEELYEEYDQFKYLLLGKSIGYSLTASLKRKDVALPAPIREHLKMFKQTPRDIDDLMLSHS